MINWKKLISLDVAASVIALCALGFSFYLAWLDRDYLRRSNEPHMQVAFYFNDEGSGFRYGNAGTGLARVVWFQILVDGEPQTNWASMLKSLGFPRKPDFQFLRPSPNSKPDNFMRIFWLKPGWADDLLRKKRDQIELRLCYCSIFDECWMESDRSDPQSVESCEPIPDVRFGGIIPSESSH